jgi:hypothetical protein
MDEKTSSLLSELMNSELFKTIQKVTEMTIEKNPQATDLDEIPEGSGRFGLEKTNPVPTRGVMGNTAYLAKIRTKEGIKIEYSRQGCVFADNIKTAIDIYEISVDAKLIDTFYLNPYHKKNSKKAPEGYDIDLEMFKNKQ